MIKMLKTSREKESTEPRRREFDWSPCNRVVTVFVAAAAPIDDRIRIRPSRVRSLSGEAKPDFDKVPRASIWTDGERRKVSGMSFETDLLMRTTTRQRDTVGIPRHGPAAILSLKGKLVQYT